MTLTEAGTSGCSPGWQLFGPSQLHKEGGSQSGTKEPGSPLSRYKWCCVSTQTCWSFSTFQFRVDGFSVKYTDTKILFVPLSVCLGAAGVFRRIVGRWRDGGNKLLKVHDVGQEGVLGSGAFWVDGPRAMWSQLHKPQETWMWLVCVKSVKCTLCAQIWNHSSFFINTLLWKLHL